mmetsp:Transcript_23160/g.39588  ORF Transcript_23160/g.39588 Transcript_23160/m.39588 type:complete len:668 (-) Transcript_23160:1430-3433(-)
MHLLTSRIPTGPSYSEWFDGCPLIVAASKNSVEMARLLLDYCYDACIPVSGTNNHTRNDSASNEVNRALLETIYRLPGEDEENSLDDTCTIIRLLIAQGNANPHIPVSIRMNEKPHTEGDKTILLSYLKGKMTQEDTPLSAAARAANSEVVRCMLDCYSSALRGFKTQRRNDPLLRSQPESYFRLLEEREDDAVYSSADSAIVTSLFLLWQENDLSYGQCALVLYKRRSLSSTSSPRNLSQKAMQHLMECLSMCLLLPAPMLRSNTMEGYYFEAPMVQYHIPDIRVKVDNFMDWSHVLSSLPWFRSRLSGVNCNWMKHTISNSSEKIPSNYSATLATDEFLLVADGEKLLAHKSIVSAKSGKLAAQIRFTEIHAQECGGRISVHVDIPLLVAKMLLQHCYHGSIAFGLMKSPMKQCHQLLELALIAEEYLCPSLILECEIRLLMQTSSPNCICPQCCSGAISTEKQIECPTRLQCLENARKNGNADDLCEPAGVYAYKTSSFIMLSGQNGLITAGTAIDVLAVSQQLEQSLSCQQGLYAIKYCQSKSIDNPNSTMVMPSFGGWDINTDKERDSGCITVPFAAAKIMAIWVQLRDFSAVIRSDSYLRQIKSDDDEDDAAEVDDSFGIGARSGSDEDAILLLQTCLEELARNPLRRNHTWKSVQKCHLK